MYYDIKTDGAVVEPDSKALNGAENDPQTDRVALFLAVTGSSDDSAATALLEAAQGNVEEAVDLFFSSGGDIWTHGLDERLSSIVLPVFR